MSAGVSQALHRRLIYPSALLLRGEAGLYAALRTLRALEGLPGNDVVKFVDERLLLILRHAHTCVPLYRERWPASVTSHLARTVPQRVLKDLPFVSKVDVQERFASLRAPSFRGRYSRKTTGGSTGQPVTILKDRSATAHERASMWQGYGWFGVEIGDRVARFWGAPFGWRGRFLALLSDAAMNRIRFSAFAFDEATLARYWDRCVRFQPDYLHGYASMLEAVAFHARRREVRGDSLRLKSVIATSEVVSDPQRNLLEEVFGAPVQVEYGCGEVGPIAYECERQSLHLMVGNVYVEILRPDGEPAGPGETGEIVVTDLHNRIMPLVRYRLGDFGVVGEACSCGRAFPVLAKVWGRAYDLVEDPQGNRYHGEFFMYLFEDLRRDGAPVEQFQVVQRSRDMLRVAVVPSHGIPAGTVLDDAVLRKFRARLPGMIVAVEQVAAIPREPSGKMRVVKGLGATSSP